MTAPFSARRRADEFEALLSRDPATTSSGPSGRDAEPYADLLEVESLAAETFGPAT